MKFKIMLIALSIILGTGRVYAQGGLASQTLKESVAERERTQQLESLSEKQKEDKDEKNKNEEKIVLLKEIKFGKSDILPAGFFEELKKKYENTQASVKDIYQIVGAVNNEYILNGYIASQAFLKEQDITSGTLFISIIEGVISKAQVSGNKSTSEKYIKRYIDFGKTDNFNANVTDKEIMNFNASNDAKARIALSPGEVFGSSVVDIIIDEPQRYSLSIFTDNAGQEETGKIRYAGYGSIKSITKYRDIFNAGGVFSEGSNAAYASYEIPEPFFNARVGAGFDYSDTYIVNGGLKPLDVKGSFYNAYIYVKKPFFIREKTVTNVTFNAASKHGVSFVSDFKTQDTKTDTLSLSADNTLLFNGGYAFNMLSYAQGAKIIEGENIFEKLAYYGEGYKSLPYNFSLNLKIKGQLIFDKAPSSEYFSIGGINSVRGYREGMLTAKDGVNTNLELIYDIGLIKWKRLNFNKIYAFFDFGNVFPDKNANLPDGYSNMLYSCGIGIKFGLFRHFETNLVCAFPLYEHKYYENDKITLLFSIHGKI